MSYTRNFDFRSTKNAVRNSRNKTPSTGTPLVIGSPVTEDAANAGLLKQAGAAEAVTPGCGILVFEHIMVQGVDPQLTSPQDAPFNVAPLGRFAQIVHGVGVKVWLRNTADKTLYDGRVQPGATLVTMTSVVKGSFLTPGTNGVWRLATTSESKWLYVDSIDATTGVVEASLTF